MTDAWDIAHSETAEDWWLPLLKQPILESDQWVAFDLATVLVDTLRHSPRITSVKHATGIQLERIVQQNAAFDSRYFMDGAAGRTNDPVGNSLITGGPPRLNQTNLDITGGIRRTGRSGTQVSLDQRLGLLDSNSLFFTPDRQGNSRLSLSLTQPLMAGRGRVYNERLVTQAQIDGRVSWQQLVGEIQERLADVMIAHCQLYQSRAAVVQQQALISRGDELERLLQARSDFDVGRLELAKLRQRRAKRVDQSLQSVAEVLSTQARLKSLVGSSTLESLSMSTELIPEPPAQFPQSEISLRDAVLRGIENRVGILTAVQAIESAALDLRVAKNQLMPRLDAVIDSYLTALNGNNDVFRSFGNQFYQSGPGIAAGLAYELPSGNRAARSRNREALHRYHQATSEFQEQIQIAQMEIEVALVRVRTAEQLRRNKRLTLQAAVEEESILTDRWSRLGADGGAAGVALEVLLEAQQRRTDAERTLVIAQTEHRIGLIQLQQAMGTLLINEGVQPIRAGASSDIDIIGPPGRTDDPDPSLVPAEAPEIDELDHRLLHDATDHQPWMARGMLESPVTAAGVDPLTTESLP